MRQTSRRVEFTAPEVARLCGVSPITVRVWITRGHLRRNARGRIDGAVLLDYLDRRADQGRTLPGDIPATAN